MATIFLAVYGKEGIRELAEHNLAKAALRREDARARSRARSCSFTGAPRFHEFVLRDGGSRRRCGASGCSKKRSSAASS